MVLTMKNLVKAGLSSMDITLSWMARRVIPLQARKHNMCFLSGPLDPTRVSKREIPTAELAAWLAFVCKDTTVADGWTSSLPPFDRQNRTPRVSCRPAALPFLLSSGH